MENEKIGDCRYVWNFNLLKDFAYQKVNPLWTVPLIQGYVECA
jgi:hypothetical protein